MGAGASRRGSPPSMLAPPPPSPAAVARGRPPVPDGGVRVMCPRCRALLLPPARLFRCPCGQLMTYELPGGGGGGGGGGGAVTAMSSSLRGARVDIERRLERLIAGLPRDDPQAAFLRALLARLPRHPDGTIDIEAMDAVLRELQAQGAASEPRGARQVAIEALPTRVFSTAALPAAPDRKEEHTSCMVCLADYEEGDTLRTLPCLHSFHQPCIDKWLATNRACPLCRFAVDTDERAILESASAASAAAAGGGSGSGGGSGGDSGGSSAARHA